MGTSSLELAKKLHKRAARQFGCFTAAQALEAGYAYSVHLYHVKNGEWIRLSRGLYRLATFPDSPEARLMLAQLWPRNKTGVVPSYFTGNTARAILSGHPENAAPPYHVCLPTSFRFTATPPPHLLLCKPSKNNAPIIKIGPFFVETSPRPPQTPPPRKEKTMTQQDASIFFFQEYPPSTSPHPETEIAAEARSIAESEAWGTWGVRPWKRTGETGDVSASVAFAPTTFAAPLPRKNRGNLDVPDYYDAMDAAAASRDVAEYLAEYC